MAQLLGISKNTITITGINNVTQIVIGNNITESDRTIRKKKSQETDHHEVVKDTSNIQEI